MNHTKELNRIREEYRKRDANKMAAESYQYTNPAYLFHIQERERAIIHFLKKNHINLLGCKILEVGCGTGSILHRFLEFGAKNAVGVDLIESRIQTGMIKYPAIRFIISNAAELPFKNGSFDLVMNFMCLSSVIDPTMRKQIAEEMWRVTRRGGHILSYDMRRIPSLIHALGKAYHNVWKKDSLPNTPLYYLSIPDLKNLFPGRVLKHKSVSLLFFLAGFSKYSFLATYLLSLFPFLHTHNLILLKKPLSAQTSK